MTATTVRTPVLMNLGPWNFNKGDVFTVSNRKYYVHRYPTKVNVWVTSLEDMKEGKFRIESLENFVKPEDIKPATAEELALLEANKTEVDPRIRFGSPVTINDPLVASQCKMTTETLCVVFKVGDGIMNVVKVGETDNRYYRIPVNKLSYKELSTIK